MLTVAGLHLVTNVWTISFSFVCLSVWRVTVKHEIVVVGWTYNKKNKRDKWTFQSGSGTCWSLGYRSPTSPPMSTGYILPFGFQKKTKQKRNKQIGSIFLTFFCRLIFLFSFTLFRFRPFVDCFRVNKRTCTRLRNEVALHTERMSMVYLVAHFICLYLFIFLLLVVQWMIACIHWKNLRQYRRNECGAHGQLAWIITSTIIKTHLTLQESQRGKKNRRWRRWRSSRPHLDSFIFSGQLGLAADGNVDSFFYSTTSGPTNKHKKIKFESTFSIVRVESSKVSAGTNEAKNNDDHVVSKNGSVLIVD